MNLSNGLRGALAGAIGGGAGGAVKLFCEKAVPPRPSDRDPPPGVLVANIVRRTSGRELSKAQKQRAAMIIHWIFSVATGSAYGVAVEANASLGASEGIPLGLALWIGLHEIALPITRATPPLRELPISEQLNESITHCAYGFSVERTRRSLRPLLDRLSSKPFSRRG